MQSERADPLLSGSYGVRRTDVFGRVREAIGAVPAVDTHEHLRPPDHYLSPEPAAGGARPEGGLRRVWRNSDYAWLGFLGPMPEPWPEDAPFDAWWPKARASFADGRAMSAYRHMLPAFRDLYGVDFDGISDGQARALDALIAERYRDPRWIDEIVVARANIALIVSDPQWAPLDFARHYPYAVPTCHVTSYVRGFHLSEFESPLDDPYSYARDRGLAVKSLEDYQAALDRIVAEAKAAGAVCLKSSAAYRRPLRFERVPRERAARAFGRPRSDLSEQEARDFEDFIWWWLVELAARHDLPLQVHTGGAYLPGSNPILLFDVIAENPDTRFVLLHGGYPWIGESGAIAMRFRNVWLDSCWLPQLSYSLGRRAYVEWLETVPSNRILWGADMGTPEGIYGGSVFTRECLSEALAEKVLRGELRESDALRIGRQVMRENALELYPSLRGLAGA